MQAKQEDGINNATIPLLLDYDDNRYEYYDDVEKAKGVEPIGLNFNGTTSFFKTTFNGLNVLSGFLLSLSLSLTCFQDS